MKFELTSDERTKLNNVNPNSLSKNKYESDEKEIWTIVAGSNDGRTSFWTATSDPQTESVIIT